MFHFYLNKPTHILKNAINITIPLSINFQKLCLQKKLYLFVQTRLDTQYVHFKLNTN